MRAGGIDETVLLDVAAIHDRLRLGDQVIKGKLDALR
jgi:hypothetical protein